MRKAFALTRASLAPTPGSQWLDATINDSGIVWREVSERLQSAGVNPDLLIIHKLQTDVLASCHRVVTHNQNEAKKRAYEETKTINFFKAYEFGLSALASGTFTLKLLRNLHKRLVTGHSLQNRSTIPGQFRTKPVWAGRIGCNIEEAHIVYLPPLDIAPYLKHWIREVNASGRWVDEFIQIAWCYQQLIGIHPFADGNGRLARLVAALMFHQRAGRDGCHFLLNEQIEADRISHHGALEATFREGSSTHWISYLSSRARLAYERDLEFAGRTHACVADAKRQLECLALDQEIRAEVLDRVFSEPVIPRSGEKGAFSPELERLLIQGAFLDHRGDVLVHPPWFNLLYALDHLQVS